MTADDPVSWFMIEPGWSVVSSDGEEAGKIVEVVGDENADIFDGLVITSSLFGKPRYVPAEAVAKIVQGRVGVHFDSAAAAELEEYREPRRP
jgi:PRC-barrel domain